MQFSYEIIAKIRNLKIALNFSDIFLFTFLWNNLIDCIAPLVVRLRVLPAHRGQNMILEILEKILDLDFGEGGKNQ